MKSLPLAVLCAVLAGPALAQVKKADPAGAKHDFTVRPQLRPHLVRPAGDPSRILTAKEAEALSEDLFSTYLNIGALSRFRFHVRTKDEAPMTADELGWVEIELKDEMAHADKLLPEAKAALKAGIERKPPLPDNMKEWGEKLKGGLMIGRFKLARRHKPTFEDYRREEHEAMGGVMLNLYELVKSASDRLAEVEPENVAKVEKTLAEDLAELHEARRKMEGAAKEAESAPKEPSATVGAASQRAKRAISGGPKGGSAAKGAGAVLEDRAGQSAGKTYDGGGIPDGGGRITPEEAARQANAVEKRAASRKKGRSPAIVPAP